MTGDLVLFAGDFVRTGDLCLFGDDLSCLGDAFHCATGDLLLLGDLPDAEDCFGFLDGDLLDLYGELPRSAGDFCRLGEVLSFLKGDFLCPDLERLLLDLRTGELLPLEDGDVRLFGEYLSLPSWDLWGPEGDPLLLGEDLF